MTKKDVMTELELYRLTQKRLDHLIHQREQLRSLAFSLGSGVGGGGGHSSGTNSARYTRAVDKLADLDGEIACEIEQLQTALKRTKTAINSCKEPKEQIILKMRYIDGMKALDIAIELDVTESYIYKLQKRGIQSICISLV